MQDHVRRLPAPPDDVLTWACGTEDGHFAVSGIDGTVSFYDLEQPQLLTRSFRAHRKAVNRLLPLPGDRILTASADATVRLWQLDGDAAASGSSAAAPEPRACFAGHGMSVSALEVCGGGDGDDSASPSVLFTGSRDCTVRLWDLATGTSLHEHKILRNVVTAVRRVPGADKVVVQASEDLQLRLWDARAGLKPVEAKGSGPNQLICLDVTSDGRFVACGSKGFSRENCEVKVFDLRAGLRLLSAIACADQTIEALRMAGPDRCIIASKDCCFRSVALLPGGPKVLFEREPGAAPYTALGVLPRSTQGPLVLAASGNTSGPSLELFSWQDDMLTMPPSLLAATA